MFSNIAQILAILKVDYVKEYQFHPARYWQFDYAIPTLKVAIEYEGIYKKKGQKSKKSRHTTIEGYRNDCEKYNEAVLHGWKLIRITNDMLKGKQAYEFIERAVK